MRSLYSVKDFSPLGVAPLSDEGLSVLCRMGMETSPAFLLAATRMDLGKCPSVRLSVRCWAQQDCPLPTGNLRVGAEPARGRGQGPAFNSRFVSLLPDGLTHPL